MRAPLSIIEAHVKTLIWNEEHVRSFDVEEHPPPSGGGSRSFFYTPLKIVQPRSAIPSDPGAQSIARHMGSFKDVNAVLSAYQVLRRLPLNEGARNSALALAKRMSEVTADRQVVVAALFSSAVASGALGLERVEAHAGSAAADLVDNVAQMLDLHGATRDLLWADPAEVRLSEAQTSAQQNMMVSMASDWRVVTLVLAHHGQLLRRAMADAGLNPSSGRTARAAYILAVEALDVYAPLAHRLGMHVLKDELEDLAFRFLHPAEHAAVVEAVQARCSEHQAVLDEALLVLKRTLQEDVEFMNSIKRVSFEARSKQPYSTWRKMQKLAAAAAGEGEVSGEHAEKSEALITQVLDHLALRVVFEVADSPEPSSSAEAEGERAARGEALAYHVLGLVHGRWNHMQFRVKDYVRYPKDNGYQSLHTTATVRYHGRVVPFEVQVRTAEMHRVAEWGKAAHATYKAEGGGGDYYWNYLAGRAGSREAATQPSAAAMEGLPLPVLSRSAAPVAPAPETIKDEKEYSMWVRDELKEQRVFVFMNTKGKTCIWDLEAGMSIKDALWRHRRLHKSVAAAMEELRVNGLKVGSDYKLRNGDAIIL